MLRVIGTAGSDVNKRFLGMLYRAQSKKLCSAVSFNGLQLQYALGTMFTLNKSAFKLLQLCLIRVNAISLTCSING